MSESSLNNVQPIRAIDAPSIHRITSGQVAVDLQTVVKELVENALDAKATNIEVRLKEYGIASIEVVDNGVGIAPEDYPSVALKHHTSKLSTFEDLITVSTFGFRGEALSSLCALCEKVGIVTATAAQGSMGTVLEFGKDGSLKSCDKKTARQRGTTVTLSGLFAPLPVRRKELERNAKREFGKMLQLMHAYALVPCTEENEGVRLSVSNQTSNGKKTVQLKNERSTSLRAAVSSLWGPKTLDTLTDLDIQFDVETERTVLRRRGLDTSNAPRNTVNVRGLISKFTPGGGRAGADRQFFYVNGRPCNPSKVQKAVNEVYKTFNATQSPFVVANFILPTDSCDINASPDKRTILLHSEANLVEALKAALADAFSASRSTFAMNGTQSRVGQNKILHRPKPVGKATASEQEDMDVDEEASIQPDALEVQGEEEDIDQIQPPKRTTSTDGPASPPSRPSSPTPPLKPRRQPAQDAAISSELPAPPPQLDDAEAEASDQGPAPSQGRLTGKSAGRVERIIAAAPNSVRQRTRERGDVVLPSTGIRDRDVVSSTPGARPRQGDSGPSSGVSVSISNHNARHVSKTREREVQMVLSTSGASWNLRPGSGEPPRKKVRLEGEGGEGSRKDMRERLKEFARDGVKVGLQGEAAKGEDEDDDDEDEVVDEDMGVVDEGGGAPVGDEDVRMDVDDGSVDIEKLTAYTTTWTTETDELKDDVSSVAPPLFLREPQENMEEDVGAQPLDHTRSAPPPDGEVVDLTAPPPTGDKAHPPASNDEIIDLTDTLPADPDHSSSVVPETSHAYSTSTRREEEFVRTVDDAVDGARLSIDLARVTRVWETLQDGLHVGRDGAAPPPEGASTTEAKAAGVDNADNEGAAEALARVLCKEDFLGMEVMGQFNMGFIIARRRKTDEGGRGKETDDLFIVDQHAADEKYNFETLQRETRIASQNLFRPRELELTAADELMAIENADVLKQNGFEIVIDDGAENEGEQETAGRRVKLVAQPMGKNTAFDLRDLEELLHLMHDRPKGTMVRCSKARTMFASRACRKSIMVGQALTTKQMTAVIRHMATMDQPWNCPHGRPTMRHLVDLRAVVGGRGREGRAVDWTRFALG